MTLLAMKGLEVTAGGKPVVRGVDLVLGRGEVLGLIGESGAGKSTIGLAALGYARPGCTITGGEVLFDGVDLRRLPEEERRRFRGRRAAYVAQSAAAAFNPARRILDQVIEAPTRHGVMGAEEARAEAVGLFRALDLPDPDRFGDRFPHQVSGGQLQRAMAAMALCCRPDLLVLDEPTTALDVTTQIEVLAALRRVIRERGTAALYISHDLAVVAQIADRILVLRHGAAVEEGPVADVLERPRMPYTQALVANRGGAAAPAEAERGPAPLLALSGVGASYASRRDVVQGIDLTIARGETLALVGESGSGKSSLARVVTGLLPRQAGRIAFDGAPLPAGLDGRSRDTLRRIQMIYQMPDVALNPRQTVGEIVGRPLTFYLGLKGRALTDAVAGLLADIDLGPDFARRYPPELSGGQKQRVCIARALAAQPDLIICDEVTSALDPLVAEGILALLGRLQRRHGYAYLFVSHDLGTVRRIAHRVAVMLEGRIVAQGPVGQVFAPPFHPYTARLLASVPEMRGGWLDEVLGAAGEGGHGRHRLQPA